MINYNPKEWFTFIFKLHKAETLVKLKWLMLCIAIYAAVVVFVEQEIFNVQKDDHVNHINAMHGTLGFVISLLLVFRTNTAYDRWWEGRKLWGSLINTSRNLAMKINAIVDDEKQKQHFKVLITNYAYALKNHLRGEYKKEEFLYDDMFTESSIKQNHHIPNQIAKFMFKEIEQLHKNKTIDGDELLLMNTEMIAFTDICGACERIKNTPIPFSYSVFLKKFIFFFVMTLPIGNVYAMGYLAVPFTIFIFYVLASVEMIGEEIEDPFGVDSNDLPTDKICNTIKISMHEILE